MPSMAWSQISNESIHSHMEFKRFYSFIRKWTDIWAKNKLPKSNFLQLSISFTWNSESHFIEYMARVVSLVTTQKILILTISNNFRFTFVSKKIKWYYVILWRLDLLKITFDAQRSIKKNEGFYIKSFNVSDCKVFCKAFFWEC